MEALVLVGHGSLRRASGAAMIRLAALARKEGVAPIATAGFLSYSRPTLAEAIERCIRKGATAVNIQPYFLISGHYVAVELPRLVSRIRARHPEVPLRLRRAFEHHPALVTLVLRRARRARPALAPRDAALLVMAHGTPHPDANSPIHDVAADLAGPHGYRRAGVGYLELNAPTIPDAIDELVASGAPAIVAVPYFLQLGAHVAEDLPRIIERARARHPRTPILLAEHLAYDPALLDVVRARSTEAASDFEAHEHPHPLYAHTTTPYRESDSPPPSRNTPSSTRGVVRT